MELKIKSEFKDTYIAFGKEPVKLGKKSQSELRDLAILAKESNNPNLAVVFDGELKDVEIETLKANRTKEQSANTTPKAAPTTVIKAAKEEQK